MLLEKISVWFSGRIFSGFISPIIKGTRKEKDIHYTAAVEDISDGFKNKARTFKPEK